MLKVYSLNQKEEWNQIIASFADHDVYYLNGYTKAFYLHGDGDPLLFYYEDENGKAANVSMKRDIADSPFFRETLESGKYYDLATPYGYGGWLIEGNIDLNSLMKEYDFWCKENDIVSEVIRFHPVLENQEKVRDIYDVMDLGNTIAIDLDSEELIWSNFTSHNRNHIKKAISNQVTIEKGFNTEVLKEFKEIYEKTMNRDNAVDYYYFDDSFYNSIETDLKDNSTVFYAKYDNKTIASSIILQCNKKLSYHLSGSLKEYGSLAATSLLLYEAAKYGSRNGYKTLHLGGGVGSKEDSLYSFKKSFNKSRKLQYSIGRRVFNKELYDELVSLRGTENLRNDFFPLYRG